MTNKSTTYDLPLVNSSYGVMSNMNFDFIKISVNGYLIASLSVLQLLEIMIQPNPMSWGNRNLVDVMFVEMIGYGSDRFACAITLSSAVKSLLL